MSEKLTLDPRPWHKAYPPQMPFDIEVEPDLTLVSLLEHAMRQHAPRPAASCQGETLSYADVDRLSRAFANHLQAAFAPGDRVALMLPSCLSFMVAMVGALRAGMIVVPINPLYTSREVEQQLLDAQAVAVV